MNRLNPRRLHNAIRTKLAETYKTDWKWLAPALVNDSLSFARRHDILSDSRALSYTFILSLVPLLAIAFTFFKLFGGLTHFLDGTLKPIILKNFPETVAQQLNAIMDSFVGNLQTGTLGIVSFATLLATVLMLMMNIEASFNRIFETKTIRSLPRRIGNYWIMLSATPLVIVLSSAKSSELLSLFDSKSGVLADFGVLQLLRVLLGHFVQVLGFATLFFVLPAKIPRVSSAFTGAVVTHFAFQLLATINVKYVSFVFSNSANHQLYGSFPLLVLVFFIWVRLVWLAVLYGACLCAAVEKYLESKPTARQRAPWTHPAETILNCIRLLEFHIDAFNRQTLPFFPSDVAYALNITEKEIEVHYDRLTNKGYLTEFKREDKDCFVPTIKALQCYANPSALLSELLDIPDDKFVEPSHAVQQGQLIQAAERILINISKP